MAEGLKPTIVGFTSASATSLTSKLSPPMLRDRSLAPAQVLSKAMPWLIWTMGMCMNVHTHTHRRACHKRTVIGETLGCRIRGGRGKVEVVATKVDTLRGGLDHI